MEACTSCGTLPFFSSDINVDLTPDQYSVQVQYKQGRDCGLRAFGLDVGFIFAP